MTIQHTCKFCSVQIALELDDSLLQSFSLDYWKSLAACNRCADFRQKKRELVEKVLRDASEWWRNIQKQIPLKPADAERLRESIVEVTKKFAELICKFHRSHLVWEPDFAQQIMDQPTKVLRILSYYESNIHKFTITRPIAAQP